jgi:membrane protease YdiL (CAAX protease family)
MMTVTPETQTGWRWWIAWSLWVVVCFIGSAVIGAIGLSALGALGLKFPVSTTLMLLGASTAIYLLMLALVISIPYAKKMVSWVSLGFTRLLNWSDIGLALAGYIIYFVAVLGVTFVITKLIPGFNASQSQDLGFTTLYGAERLLGFVVLVVVAPIVEETIFRGFLYGKLRESRMPMWPAILTVSALFGLAHGQWNVGIGTFILSIVLCYLREATGSVWAGILVHMINNAIAFTLLFVTQVPY